jgi:dCMP deaminase
MSQSDLTFPKDHRISVELYAMCLAWVASLRSEDPFHKVGCAALNAANRVIATGYNGLKPGQTLTEAEWMDREGRLKHVIHAERNALSLCSPGEIQMLAVTTLPCSECAKAVIDFGVQLVIYGKLYHRDSSAIETFHKHGVETRQVPIDLAKGAIVAGFGRESACP